MELRRSEQKRIPDGSFPVRAGSDDVAVDPITGDLYSAWTDTRYNDGSHNDIVVSRSTDGGLSWSTPAKVSKNPVGVAAFTPSAEVNVDGDIAVTYYDFRNAQAGSVVATDYWIAISKDYGATWGEDRMTFGGSFDIAIAPVPPAWRGYFLGDYEGLTSAGSTFLACMSSRIRTRLADARTRCSSGSSPRLTPRT
jgi:hypothetical protein